MNDVVIKSGRKLAVGPDLWEIRDAGSNIEFVDFITEARHSSGIIYLSLGSGSIDANNEGVVDIVSRIRMSLPAAQFLRDMIDQCIKGAMTPPVKADKKKVN